MSATQLKNKPKRILATRLVIYILLCSSLITLVLTALQLYREYQIDVSHINQRLQEIELTSVSSLTRDLWVMNRDAIELYLKGIASLPDITYVSVSDESGTTFSSVGTETGKNIIVRDYPLRYKHRDQDLQIGTLHAIASLEGVYQRLIDRFIIILVSQAAKTFLVSLFIFFIFQHLVTRHLTAIADYLGKLRMHGNEAPLVLKRRESRRSRTDELTQVAAAINTMQTTLRTAYRTLLGSHAQLETMVQQRTHELEQKNSELSAFCYSVSHDLRTPLRSINGFSTILMEDHTDNLDDDARHYLQRIAHSAEHMGELMDDLLSLSRVSQHELEITEVDVSGIGRDVIARLRDHDPDREISCQIQDGMTARADRGLLVLALDNLLGNAWKYTGHTKDARIELLCSSMGDEVVFIVRDNGAGFDMQYADKLFKPFNRLHPATEFEGTGIGLATVKRVVERHGGRVWVEATPDEGATFYFMLGQSVGTGEDKEPAADQAVSW